MVVFTDKSKTSWSQELTALRAVCEGGGRVPQKGNRTRLQTVRGEEGRVQPGGAAKENREEGGEGRGEATDIVGAGGRQCSVVSGVGGTGLANSGQHGLDGKVGDGGR